MKKEKLPDDKSMKESRPIKAHDPKPDSLQNMPLISRVTNLQTHLRNWSYVMFSRIFLLSSAMLTQTTEVEKRTQLHVWSQSWIADTSRITFKVFPTSEFCFIRPVYFKFRIWVWGQNLQCRPYSMYGYAILFIIASFSYWTEFVPCSWFTLVVSLKRKLSTSQKCTITKTWLETKALLAVSVLHDITCVFVECGLCMHLR